VRKERSGGPAAVARRGRKSPGKKSSPSQHSREVAAVAPPGAAATDRPPRGGDAYVTPVDPLERASNTAYPSPFLLDDGADQLPSEELWIRREARPLPTQPTIVAAELPPQLAEPEPPEPESPEPSLVLDAVALAEMTEAGLFDPNWYAGAYRDVALSGMPAAEHYLRRGAAEGRKPNPHFDPAWYRQAHPEAAAEPLLGYFRSGEAQGFAPSPGFDPAWYRERYLGAFRGISALGHYLQSRAGGRVDPNAWFDTQFYLRMNPDVAAAGRDPFEHFLAIGFQEGRDPSAHFDLRFYQRRYLAGAPAGTNPLLHFLETGRALGYATEAAADPFPASEVRRFSTPAAEFEEVDAGIGAGRKPLAKLIAFYLTQFHPFPENDEWWGKGFTEWTNISRGMPRFPGHYQPRVPRDFGFYDLRDNSVMRRQIEAARAAGLHGFCFYYYNFNGHRLLEGPLERFLADRETDWPFCIMWANENWSRRWDGSEAEILIRQDYLPGDAGALVDDIARHFKDPRYIRIDGRPLFFIYRAGIIPEAERTIAEWRRLFRERHGEEPWIYIAQTFAEHDPRLFGCDGAVEFPPHKVTQAIPPINDELRFFDHSFSGYVYRYEDVARAAMEVPTPEFPLIRTVFPSWDNDARRQGRGVIMKGSTPEKYQVWLEAAIAWSRRHPVGGENIVFINAWNEWAEGAYLEPDIHFGGAYLNTTARTVFGRAAHSERRLVVLVAGQPTREQPQTLTRQIGRQLQRRHGVEVAVLMVGKGPVRAGPTDYGFVSVATDRAAIAAEAARLAGRGAHAAILFGVAAGEAIEALHGAGLRTVAVVQDMPGSIRAANQGEWAEAIARDADVVVAPYPAVLSAIEEAFGGLGNRAVIRAQAPASPPDISRAARSTFREDAGLDPFAEVVVGAGPATMRNGIDLFAAVARQVRVRRKGVAFVWLGGVPDAETRRWLTAGFGDGELIFRPVPEEGLRDAVAAADLLLSTAREEAEPVLAVESLAAGLPVVGFADTGGIADVIGGGAGRLVPFADTVAMAGEVVALLESGAAAAAPVQAARERSRLRRAFTETTAALLADAEPDLPRISAVVLSGGARPEQVTARLASIFDQTHPVFETLFIEDRATPEQRSLVRDFAEAGKREVAIRPLPAPVARQGDRWLAALALAEGEYVWLAPSTGSADPALLATLAAAFDGDGIDAAICRSQTGEPPSTGKSRRSRYAADDGKALAARLERDAEFGADLGAVLWRRSALVGAIESLRESGGVIDVRGVLAAIAGKGRIAVLTAELSKAEPAPAPSRAVVRRPRQPPEPAAMAKVEAQATRPARARPRQPARSAAAKARPAKPRAKPVARNVAAADRPAARKGVAVATPTVRAKPKPATARRPGKGKR